MVSPPTPLRPVENSDCTFLFQKSDDDALDTPRCAVRDHLEPNLASVKMEDDDDQKLSLNTPTAKKSLLGPRTPTPFKNALDEFRKIRGQTYVPSSPNGLVEDITEIMNKERQQDNTMDSVYDTDSSVLTQNVQNESESSASNTTNPKRLSFDEGADTSQQSNKKAKKSLDATWNSSSADDFPYVVETPVSAAAAFRRPGCSNGLNERFQSKALNSNSGVAFSPPSIVKDALGDSGLLMDPEATITNSPDSSAQVYNIINSLESKLMMRDGSGSSGSAHHHDNHSYNHHLHHHQSTFPNRFNLKDTQNSNPALVNRIRSFNTQNQVQIPNFIKLTEKTFPMLRRTQTDSNIPRGGGGAEPMRSSPSQDFNPFADENEGIGGFQLSKSSEPNEVMQSASRMRAFGVDRTNFQFVDQAVAQGNFKHFLQPHNLASGSAAASNVTIKVPHGIIPQNRPEIIDENTVMFKTYDLNDDYWLNFE